MLSLYGGSSYISNMFVYICLTMFERVDMLLIVDIKILHNPVSNRLARLEFVKPEWLRRK